VRAEKRRALQRTIYEAAPWAPLPQGRDEYEDPIRISKPLTLQGASGVVWARRGPVAPVGSPAVALRNLLIEVTVLDGGGESNDADVR
jgi:hypothetical protein